MFKLAFFLAAGASIAASAASSTCALQYVGTDKVVYQQSSLQSFVDNEVRPKLSTSSKTFTITVSNVCGSTTQSSLTLGIDPDDFYVVTIDGKTLTDSQSTYTTANAVLSLANLQSAYTSALSFQSSCSNESSNTTSSPASQLRVSGPTRRRLPFGITSPSWQRRRALCGPQ